MDTPTRSWTKSITWRMAGVIILGGITYWFTRDIAETTGITILFHVMRFVLYYVHERMWDRVQWGTARHPLAAFQTRPDLSGEDLRNIRRFLEDHGYAIVQPLGSAKQEVARHSQVMSTISISREE